MFDQGLLDKGGTGTQVALVCLSIYTRHSFAFANRYETTKPQSRQTGKVLGVSTHPTREITRMPDRDYAQVYAVMVDSAAVLLNSLVAFFSLS